MAIHLTQQALRSTHPLVLADKAGARSLTSWREAYMRQNQSFDCMPRLDKHPIVLLICAVAESRMTYRYYLRRGYQFLEAESATRGLALCREARPDCLLIDDQLPDMRTSQVLGALRTEMESNAFAVVLITRAQGLKGAEATTTHVSECLEKDQISSENLPRAIASALEKVRLRRELDRYRRADEELAVRHREQEAIAYLGRQALAEPDLHVIMQEAAESVADTLQVDCSKILQLLPGQKQFRLVAGVGWQTGLVGRATIAASLDSQAGYTVVSRGAVNVLDLKTEARFRGCPFLLDHGIVSGLSCVIAGTDGDPYGVVGAHTKTRRVFSEHETHFLLSVANIIASAIRRKRAEEGLSESEERYRKLIDASPVAILVIKENRLVFVNDQAVTLFGAEERSELVAKSPFDLFHSDYHELIRKRVPAIEEKIIRFDGTIADVEVSTAPFLDRGENAVQVMLHDISARKRAQEALRTLTEDLERRVMERTQELAGSRQRLRALLSDLTLAEERERRRLAVELHDYLAQTLTLSRMKLTRAHNLAGNSDLKQLMNDARISLDESLAYTRTLMAELSPRVLYDVGLAAALRWLGERMRRHGLSVEVSGEPDRLVLPEDQAILMFQCVREVLWNVVKHANAKKASLSYSVDQGALTVVVADDGKGFDPKTLRRGGATGTQFGLFSVRERFELEEGQFEVASSPGQGSRVTLRLPIAQACEAKTEPDGRRTARAEVKAETQTIRVALVDDHQMVRQGLRSVLQDHAELTIVGEAGDGLEAVEMAQRIQPDVVVMDLNLPVLNGIEATKRIIQEHPNTIVIGLSFGINTYITAAMKAAGAVTCITKERAVEELYRTIKDSVAGP